MRMRISELARLVAAGRIIQVDTTFGGCAPGKAKERAYHHKMKVLTLTDREAKQGCSVVVSDLDPTTIVAAPRTLSKEG
jgi:hypothetical protein